MLPSLPMLVVSLTMQAGTTRYTLGLSANANYVTNQGEWASPSSTALQMSPALGLVYTDRSLALSLSYFPLATLVPNAPPPQYLHRVQLAVGNNAPESRLGLAAKVDAAYGTNNFRLQQVVPSSATRTGTTGAPGTPTSTPPPTVQPVPLAPSLDYLNASAGVAATSRLGPRVRLQGEAAYVAQGGADEVARATLPLGHGPTLGLRLAWQPARDHSLTTGMSASYLSFIRTGPDPNAGSGVGSDSWAAVLDEAWRYRLSPAMNLSLAVGVGTSGDAVRFPELVVRRVLPAGTAGLDGHFGAVAAAMWMRLAPYVDFTSGVAYERGDASLYLGWPPHRDWMLEATASGGEALDGLQRGQVTATAQVMARWQAARWSRFFLGLSTLWQQAGTGFRASSFQQWSLSVGGEVSTAGRL